MKIDGDVLRVANGVGITVYCMKWAREHGKPSTVGSLPPELLLPPLEKFQIPSASESEARELNQGFNRLISKQIQELAKVRKDLLE